MRRSRRIIAAALLATCGFLVLFLQWHQWVWVRLFFASVLWFEAWNQWMFMREEARVRAARLQRRLQEQEFLRDLKAAEAHASVNQWDLWSVLLVMQSRYEQEEKNAEDEHGDGEPVS